MSLYLPDVSIHHPTPGLHQHSRLTRRSRLSPVRYTHVDPPSNRGSRCGGRFLGLFYTIRSGSTHRRLAFRSSLRPTPSGKHQNTSKRPG